MTQKQLMILVAGPYRSGTNDDPELIKIFLEQYIRQNELPVYICLRQIILAFNKQYQKI